MIHGRKPVLRVSAGFVLKHKPTDFRTAPPVQEPSEEDNSTTVIAVRGTVDFLDVLQASFTIIYPWNPMDVWSYLDIFGIFHEIFVIFVVSFGIIQVQENLGHCLLSWSPPPFPGRGLVVGPRGDGRPQQNWTRHCIRKLGFTAGNLVWLMQLSQGKPQQKHTRFWIFCRTQQAM